MRLALGFFLALGLWATGASRADLPPPETYLLGQELKLYSDSLARFIQYFEVRQLQSRVRPRELEVDDIQNYVFSERGWKSLPAELRAKLGAGLRLGMVTSLESPPKPKPKPKSLRQSEANEKPSIIIVSALDRPTADLKALEEQVPQVPYDLILPRDPIASPDYLKLQKRWRDYWTRLTPEAKDELLNYSHLPRDVQARIALDRADGEIELREDLSPAIRKIFENIYWEKNRSGANGGDGSLEFRQIVPESDPRIFLATLRRLAEISGTTEILDHPLEGYLRVAPFHFQFSRFPKHATDELRALRARAVSTFGRAERIALAHGVERRLAQLQEKLPDEQPRAEALNFLLLARAMEAGIGKRVLQPGAQVTFRQVGRASYSGPPIKGLTSYRDGTRTEVRIHFDPPEKAVADALGWFEGNRTAQVQAMLLDAAQRMPGRWEELMTTRADVGADFVLALRALPPDKRAGLSLPDLAPAGILSPEKVGDGPGQISRWEMAVTALRLIKTAPETPGLADSIAHLVYDPSFYRWLNMNHQQGLLAFLRGQPKSDLVIKALVRRGTQFKELLDEVGPHRLLLGFEECLRDGIPYHGLSQVVWYRPQLEADPLYPALVARIRGGEFPLVAQHLLADLHDFAKIIEHHNYQYFVPHLLEQVRTLLPPGESAAALVSLSEMQAKSEKMSAELSADIARTSAILAQPAPLIAEATSASPRCRWRELGSKVGEFLRRPLPLGRGTSGR